MGKYDLPAISDYILNYTKETNPNQRLSYVGHSMGTTIFFVFTSLHPEYNKYYDAMVALPPSALLSRMSSPAKYLAPFAKTYVRFTL